MIHKHNWIKIKETYAYGQSINTEGISSTNCERLLFGLTTILWECSICQKIRKEEMLGKEKCNEKTISSVRPCPVCNGRVAYSRNEILWTCNSCGKEYYA